jgi:hypothetical protein
MKSAVALLAVTTAVVTGSAVAAGPPSPSVSCIAGGTTSFAHPPHGTDSVMFMYTPTVFFTWVSGAKRAATPVEVNAGDPVVATFYSGQTPIGDPISTTCS